MTTNRMLPAALATAALIVGVALAGPAFAGASSRHGQHTVHAHRSRTARQTIEFPSTPYMGVDTWYAFWRDIDQAVVVRYTNAMVKRGFKRAGYRYVWLDAGWWQGQRNADGQIVVSRQQWPYGMKWLVWYIHSKGLLAGIYTDAGTDGCQNAGSFKHYQGDVDTFARWGFDAVKVDFCGGRTLDLSPSAAYRKFAAAISYDSPHRPMLLAICNAAVPYKSQYGDPTYGQSAYAAYSYARTIAASWRTGPDEGVPDDVSFDGVLRSIVLDSRHPRAAGDGHWNDPDYLTPDQGMSYQQARAQFTMWAILAAPLMVSANIGRMPAWIVQMYENRTLIAIDQDPLGLQGHRVHRWRRTSLWVRQLAGGSLAVAVLNHSAHWGSASVSPAELGFRRGKAIDVEDVWHHSSWRTKRPSKIGVPADGAVLLLVKEAPTAASHSGHSGH
jgi:alpha-galactosidase